MNLACRFNQNGSFRRRKFPQISSFEIRQRAKTFLGLKRMGVHQLSDREPFVQPHSRRNHGRNVTIVFAFHSIQNNHDLGRHQIVQGCHVKNPILSQKLT